jgi:predicted nucleotidyltransferase component of viral defense system
VISRAQITRTADRDGVSARAVERDYVIDHILDGLAGADVPNLVFKGGTALRFCRLEDFRFSADLDFSARGVSADDARATLGGVLEATREARGFEVLELDASDPPRIRYVGPLQRERTVKLDLTDDELVVQTERRPVRTHWPDVDGDGALTVYSVSETGGEKLRCVVQRLQCRDLYDLDVLFETLGLDPAEAAARFDEKARHRGIDPRVFAERYEARLESYEDRWEAELAEHMRDPPHFDAVSRRVGRKLRVAGLI